MPDGNKIPRHLEETCQSLKSHGMQLQAPALLTAAESHLCHAGVRDPRGSAMIPMLIDVHSLSSVAPV